MSKWIKLGGVVLDSTKIIGYEPTETLGGCFILLENHQDIVVKLSLDQLDDLLGDPEETHV